MVSTSYNTFLAGIVKNLAVENKNKHLVSIGEEILNDYLHCRYNLPDYDSITLVARVAMYMRNGKIPDIALKLVDNFKWLISRQPFDENVAASMLDMIIRFRVDDYEIIQLITKRLIELPEVTLKTKILSGFASSLMDDNSLLNKLKIEQEEIEICLLNNKLSEREKIFALWQAVYSGTLSSERLR